MRRLADTGARVSFGRSESFRYLPQDSRTGQRGQQRQQFRDGLYILIDNVGFQMPFALIVVDMQFVGDAAQLADASVASQPPGLVQDAAEVRVIRMYLPSLRCGDGLCHVCRGAPALFRCLMQFAYGQIIPAFG